MSLPFTLIIQFRTTRLLSVTTSALSQMPQAVMLKQFEVLHILLVKWSCFTSVQQNGTNGSVVRVTFYWKRNITSAPQIQQIRKCHSGFTEASNRFRANATIITQNATKVGITIKRIKKGTGICKTALTSGEVSRFDQYNCSLAEIQPDAHVYWFHKLATTVQDWFLFD